MAGVELSEEQLAELRAAVKPDTYDRSVAARAQIVVWYHEGHRKADIAKRSGASRPTIDKWIDRYARYGLDGLSSRTSPGGPRTIPGHIRGRVLARTRPTPPEEPRTSHWTPPAMPRHTPSTAAAPLPHHRLAP